MIREKQPDNGNIIPELLVLLPNPILFLHSEKELKSFYKLGGKKEDQKKKKEDQKNVPKKAL